MRFFRPISLFVLLLVVMLVADSSNQLMAQDDDEGISVGVIDMQEVLTDYYKTKIEVDKLNILVDRREAKIKALAGELKEMLTSLGELRKKLEDDAISKKAKKKLAVTYKEDAQRAGLKEKEMTYHRRKAGVEIKTARSEMETNLLKEIKAEVEIVIAASGVDLVFDKSFLPKANKLIMFTSSRLNDLSAKVVESLNAKAP